MNKFVVYDSLYGNTEKIAKAIGEGISSKKKVKVVFTGDAKDLDYKGIDLLIVGSPTHGGRPSPNMAEFLKNIPDGNLKNTLVTAFDTRFYAKEQGIGLRVLMTMIQYAAGRSAKALTKKGGKLVAEPEGFFVKGKEGPLKEGELERAKKWGAQIAKSLKK